MSEGTFAPFFRVAGSGYAIDEKGTPEYNQLRYGWQSQWRVEDDELEGWMPTEHSPYFAFETKYTKASKRLMPAKTSLTLATAGCALDGKAFEASSFVDALEAVEAQC